jgi:tetratricopeptide (TPR) repeat protein
VPEHKETKILDPTALGLIAALAAVVLYIPAIQFGWVWDDKVLVTSQGHTVLEGFRPLAALLFRLEWSLGYGTPLIAHLTSVLLHGVATFLFFRLALSLTAGPVLAFVTSLLFAAHPVHVEAVAYISGRPDLLATTLALLALLIARREEFCTPEGCRSLKIWAAYIAYGAALLSDEVALATPFVLVGLDLWGPKPVPLRWRRTHYSGFLAITLVYLLVRFVSGHGFASAAGAAAIGIEPAARAWSVPMAIFESLRVLFVPHPLNALRTLTAADAASTANRIAPFLALLGIAMVVTLRRRDPLARAGGLLLLIPLVPSLPIPPFVGSYVEERSLYFASVGACLLVGSIYAAVRGAMPRAGLVLATLACGIAAAAGLGTQMRLPVWKDNTTLLLAAAKADPKDSLPHIMLADYFSNEENWPAAEAAIDRAVKLDPSNHGALVRQVAILNRRGKFEQSAIAAHRALAMVPNDAMTLTNLSDALVHTDKAAEGAEAAGRAIALDSTLVNAWYNYGVSLAAAGRIPQAIAAYRKTVELEPGHILALNNLGALLGQSGQLVEARELYRRLVLMAPNSVEAHMNLALVYLRLGDRNAASRERESVRRLSPNAVQELDAVFRQYQSQLPVLHPSRPRGR